MIASTVISALLGVATGYSLEYANYVKMEHSTDQCKRGYVPVKTREDCIAAGYYLGLDNAEYPSIEDYNFETPYPHCIYLDQRMQYYPNGQGGWKNTNGHYICKRMEYHLAPLGAKSCDWGQAVEQRYCQGAVAMLAEYLDETPARTVQVLPYDMPACTTSGWSKVPVGCSAQTGGDWAAHFKPEGHAVCDTDVVSPYQVVCENHACMYMRTQDECTGACRWVKDSCREPCSAIDKRTKCRGGCEWDSQEKVCKDECSWTTPANRGLFVLVCEDGSECNGQTDGWDCCTAKGGRAQCPQNYPYMCEDKTCGGNTAHCCSTLANCDNAGGLRTCQGSDRRRSRKDCDCPWTFEPVCGENNKTYLNECEAECHGHEVLKKGWCGGWTGKGRRRVSHMLRRRSETQEATQTSVRRRADKPSTTVRRLQGVESGEMI